MARAERASSSGKSDPAVERATPTWPARWSRRSRWQCFLPCRGDIKGVNASKQQAAMMCRGQLTPPGTATRGRPRARPGEDGRRYRYRPPKGSVIPRPEALTRGRGRRLRLFFSSRFFAQNTFLPSNSIKHHNQRRILTHMPPETATFPIIDCPSSRRFHRNNSACLC